MEERASSPPLYGALAVSVALATPPLGVVPSPRYASRICSLTRVRIPRRPQRKDWIALVAVHSDAWLLAVAFFFGAKFDKNDR